MTKRKTYKPIITVPLHKRLADEGTPIDSPEKAIMSAMILHMDIGDHNAIYQFNKLAAKYPGIARF